MCGVDVLVVDLSGSGLFRPQSPLPKELSDVSTAACTGYGRVAVSELEVVLALRSAVGFGSCGGKENSLEFLSRFAVGDNRLIDILLYSNAKYVEAGPQETHRSDRPKIDSRNGPVAQSMLGALELSRVPYTNYFSKCSFDNCE